MNRNRIPFPVPLVFGLTLLGACSSAPGGIDTEELRGADDAQTSTSALDATIPVGTTLVTTGNVNLRSGPSADQSILEVLATGSRVVVINRADPVNGWYNVRHDGTEGWTSGTWLARASDSSTDPTTPPATSKVRQDAIARAKTAVSFSYWWGHGRWTTANVSTDMYGSCSGECPNCTHQGNWGADCSGYVAKVWQIPASNTSIEVDAHPYSTYDFYNAETEWKAIPTESVQMADAFVMREADWGHIVLFEAHDAWGSSWAYEAKDCLPGIVYNLRTFGPEFKAITRKGW